MRVWQRAGETQISLGVSMTRLLTLTLLEL